jgi:hypothetical protein
MGLTRQLTRGLVGFAGRGCARNSPVWQAGAAILLDSMEFGRLPTRQVLILRNRTASGSSTIHVMLSSRFVYSSSPADWPSHCVPIGCNSSPIADRARRKRQRLTSNALIRSARSRARCCSLRGSAGPGAADKVLALYVQVAETDISR